MITTGDCVEVMAAMEAASIDAIVTDPPYNLEFMGKAWDRNHQHEPWAREALRVAKPGAYLLAFGGTRTYHRLAVAIEDAGWVIRDCLVWAYASGFPKGKANLKPAWEPIVMARKPGPLRTLNIDGCRIGMSEDDRAALAASMSGNANWRKANQPGPAAMPITGEYTVPAGRWPANVILTSPIFDGGIDGVVGGGETGQMPATYQRADGSKHGGMFYGSPSHDADGSLGYGDTGTYSRFFLIPKAARSEREPVFGGLEERTIPIAVIQTKGVGEHGKTLDGKQASSPRRNVHPTVKPVDLMRHLVRLVTPIGGTVLDPFLGSGTTAVAAENEGFRWIGIEREPEYVAIATARLEGNQQGLAL